MGDLGSALSSGIGSIGSSLGGLASSMNPFGGTAVDRATVLNVTCTVETRASKVGKGFGSMPLGNVWSFPSRRLTYDDTLAAMNRPDLRAAQQGVTAAESQLALQKANGKMDITGTFNYTRTNGTNSGAFFYNMPLPIFSRNQGEIQRAQYAITQAQELASETAQQVSTDVIAAYANLESNDEIIRLYQSGYVDMAKQSRDISEYAYQRGAASLLDYLDSERTYRANQLAYRQALASYMLALEQMRQAVGTRNLP